MEHHNKLATHLLQSNLFSNDEIEYVCQHFIVENIPKNNFFLEAGNNCTRIGFLLSGVLCSFIYDSEGEMVVKHFVEPDQFFTDLQSYENNIAAALNIQAVVESEILYIRKEDSENLQKENPKWQHSLSIFSSKALNKMIQTQNFLRFGSAVDKYHYFVKHHPNLARQVPLKFISSYLGITQSSLSRIRRE